GPARPGGAGGLAVAGAVAPPASLGGKPVLAVRYSEGDPRGRHRGLSHHTRAVLSLAEGAEIAWPEGLAVPEELERVTSADVTGWEDACAGLPPSHMGRGPDEDPWFFSVAYAAGRVASGFPR